MKSILISTVVIIVLASQVTSHNHCLKNGSECSTNADCCDNHCHAKICAIGHGHDHGAPAIDARTTAAKPLISCDKLECPHGQMCYQETIPCHSPPCPILDPHCAHDDHIHTCDEVICPQGQECHSANEDDPLPSCKKIH